MIATTYELYAFAELAMQRCSEVGYDDIARELDDAMHLGSSGMEILGAIKTVFTVRAAALEGILEKAKVEEVIKYVNKAFGLE